MVASLATKSCKLLIDGHCTGNISLDAVSIASATSMEQAAVRVVDISDSGNVTKGSTSTSSNPATFARRDLAAKYEARGDYLSEKFAQFTMGRGKIAWCHVVGSEPHRPKSGSWIQYWKTHIDQVLKAEPDKRRRSALDCLNNAEICSFSGCMNVHLSQSDMVGAHIQKAGSFASNASWYIVPACKACNNRWKTPGMVSHSGRDAIGPKCPLKKGVVPVKVSWRNPWTPRAFAEDTKWVADPKSPESLRVHA